MQFCALLLDEARSPTFFISDNGTSFVALAKALRRSNLSWRTLPEAAPWWNGFTERMVGSVKNAAKKTCGRRSFSRNQLETVLCQLEASINRRPLIVDENGETITPAHFLYGATPPSLMMSLGQELPDSSSVVLGKLARIRRQLSLHLWNRWSNEYLVSLRQWRRQKGPVTKAKVGQVVIVQPPDGIRMSWDRWRLGLITDLLVGPDGEARAAALRIGGRVTRRPLSRLVPLEVE